MVTRCYICYHCSYKFTVKESIHDIPQTLCPECHIAGLFQDLIGQIHIVVRDPTTLGQQAERNAKALGKYGLEEAKRKDKKAFEKRKLDSLKAAGVIPETAEEIPVPKPWYNPNGENLTKKLKNIKTKKAAKKYIMEGKIDGEL